MTPIDLPWHCKLLWVDVTQVAFANAKGPRFDAFEDGELSAVSQFADGGRAVPRRVVFELVSQ